MVVLRDGVGEKQAETPSLPPHTAGIIGTECTLREILHDSQHTQQNRKWPPMRVWRCTWLLRGLLGHRRAPGKTCSLRGDIFRIKSPCVAVVTSHQMQSLCCATHSFSHDLFRELKFPYTAKKRTEKKKTSSRLIKGRYQIRYQKFEYIKLSHWTRSHFSRFKVIFTWV